MSGAEYIATSLELRNMFNKISKINIPLFVDDNERCVDFNFIEDYLNDSQIIIAEAKKGQKLEIKGNNIEQSNCAKVA